MNNKLPEPNELVSKTIDELEASGYRIIDVIAGDAPSSESLQYLIDKIREEKRDNFYSDLLFSLTSERFQEHEAKQLWQEILQHKYVVSEILKRNIGIRVAALDYLENIKRIIDQPKIVDETEFLKTIKLAETDPLTGVFNRRAFLGKLTEKLQMTTKHKEKFCILLLDLDGFKAFNDKEGHQAGDLILQEFSLLLKNTLINGTIGRYGGDEFIVLIDNADKYKAKLEAEKIRKRIETEFKSINITVSIGIAEFPTDATTSHELISEADEVLYRAKEFGGNKVAYFKEVEFNYKSEDKKANQVNCVGDFNKWNKNLGLMNYNCETNSWQIKLRLKPGKYRYKFLVDGTKWIADPQSTEFTDDGFGGKCSVITVTLE